MESNCLTENNDKAYATSGSACLDFFTRITRSAEIGDYLTSFQKAWAEDKESALKLLMNMRDVRNGKGEKLIPAVLMVLIKRRCTDDVYEELARLMVDYGYWKDLLTIMEIDARLTSQELGPSPTPIETKLFAQQLKLDLENLEKSGEKTAITLCAKWAPTEDSHFDSKPMQCAKKIMKEMHLKPKEYRQMLTKLRNHLKILETLMCGGRFEEIDFSKLPSVAHMKNKKAFLRGSNADGLESEPRSKLKMSYEAYLQKLKEGKTKVNVVGIQPHELVSTYLNSGVTKPDTLVEEQWNAVKKRVTEAQTFRNVTAIVDVSGSMSGQPMTVSIALGILVAECTTGPYYGKVITFSQNPEWHYLRGSNLMEKVKCMSNAKWGTNTNLQAVFEMILQNAKQAKLTQNEMVKTLFIFTDMQFDQCTCSPFESTFEHAKRTFGEAGYTLPNIVCWNLRTSSTKSMPIDMMEKNFVMLSCFSAELLKLVLTTDDFSPMKMLHTALSPYNVPERIMSKTPSQLNVSTEEIADMDLAVKKSIIKKCFKPKASTDSKATEDSELPVCMATWKFLPAGESP